MPNSYVTKSLYLSAYLYSAKGMEFIGTSQPQNGNIYFEFEPKEKAEKLIKDYYTGKAKCNPRDIFESYKTLKDLIFEVKNTHHRENLSSEEKN